ncbi:glycosyltransferase [Dechloromonas sp. TW-R-39-2]|uniref:glycosyltransferase family 4 protein n=1 Tax=Dechloromonas sp. TW-R-39-2 TaxID=2654218 RepID=UPI00193D3CCF|nr:glycosyltransferase [Dechloromonas sp. TW-R-39-2]QRM18684.1 glycosyltransferase [Dechloromonas sp. TW-R-39-2]
MTANNILLLQTAIGDYRQAFLEEVFSRLGDRFSIMCGDRYFESSLITGIKKPIVYSSVNNCFVLNRRFLFQWRAVFPAVMADVVVLELNPRIITNWIVVFLRKIFGKKTIFWGHAWPRKGISSHSDVIRSLMRALSDVLIVYTETQKSQLQKYGFDSGRLIAAPNALYRKQQMQSVVSNRDSFIYVGRLVESKKILLAIKSFSLIKNRNIDAKLLIVGDGPLRSECENLVSRLGLNECVLFFGHISDELELAKLYSRSVSSLSPGYIGLSITQSLGFGVPVVISRDEPHAPEIEAAVEGENCIFFDTDSEQSLADSMILIWNERNKWADSAAKISDSCKNNYSAEIMADRFVDALNRCGLAV